MFWVFKLSFAVDILAFFDLVTFWGYSLKKFGKFFSNRLVTLTMTFSADRWIGAYSGGPGILDKLSCQFKNNIFKKGTNCMTDSFPRCLATQHNDTKHNDVQHNDTGCLVLLCCLSRWFALLFLQLTNSFLHHWFQGSS
jgi:hypothetical protein